MGKTDLRNSNLGRFRASSMKTFKTEFLFFDATFSCNVVVVVVVIASVAVDLFDVVFDFDDAVEMIDVWAKLSSNCFSGSGTESAVVGSVLHD